MSAPSHLHRPPLALLLASTLALGASACSGSPPPAAGDGAAELGAPDRGADLGPDAAADLGGPDQPGPDAYRLPDLYAQAKPQLGQLSLVVNLGDSIAAGYGVASGQAYIDLLMDNDDALHPAFKGKDLETLYPGVKLSDVAAGGSTSEDLPKQLAKVPSNPSGSTLVIISIGGNDLAFNFQVIVDPSQLKVLAAKVKTNLGKVLTHFADQTRYPGKVTLLIFNILEFTDGLGTIPQDAKVNDLCSAAKVLGAKLGSLVLAGFAQYNQELVQFAAANGMLVGDLHGIFLGHGFNHADKGCPCYRAADPTLWFQSDCIHPNAAGQAGIRAEVWRVLSGAL